MLYKLLGREWLDDWLKSPEGQDPELSRAVRKWIFAELLSRPHDQEAHPLPGQTPAVFSWAYGTSVAITYYVRDESRFGPVVQLLDVRGPYNL